MGFYASERSIVLFFDSVAACNSVSVCQFSTLLSICFRTCTDLDAGELCGPSYTEFLTSLLEGELVIVA